MARVLTVDDSRAIRLMVAKQVQGMGLEVDEAEHGEEGLQRLAAGKYDLVVLDVTMPVLDGPAMLKKMREGGDQTPVLMLTSESKRSIVTDAMKLGITDYIMKPFEPNELLQKIQRVLKIPGAASVAAVEAPRPTVEVGAAVAGKQFSDVLVIDDMENVQKRLRTLLPQHISMAGSVSAQQGLTICRDRVFRLLLIDNDMPDVNTETLLGQLRLLQSNAACVALALRAGNDYAALRAMGFDDVLFKPFDQGAVDDILARYFDRTEIMECTENHIHIAKYTGKVDRIASYYEKLTTSVSAAMEKVAAACFDDAILDLSDMVLEADLTPHTVIRMAGAAKHLGLSVKVVAPAETEKVLKTFLETSDLLIFPTVAAAKAA